MAILEKIRKRSLFLILVIGLALFAFVISGVIRKGNFGSLKTNIGEVNGENIPRDEFLQEVEAASRRYGASLSTLQLVNQVWDQQVRQKLLEQQYEELGIRIEKDQIINVIKSNPGFAQDSLFMNEAGVFDEGKFIEFIADLRANNPAGFEQWKLQEEMLINAAREQAYFNLIRAGINTTLTEGELSYKAENDKVAIRYVQIPYTSIPDSTVTISQAEIKAYANNHKKEFEAEPLRSIQYVYFEEKASPEDEKEVKDRISALLKKRVEYNTATNTNDTLAGFGSTSDIENFVNRNSDIPYDSAFVAKKDLPAAVADTLFTLPAGTVYGPYKDGDYFKISRIIAKKPGASVKTSHILIAYEGSERALPTITRTKEEAKAKAETLLKEVKKDPQAFAQMARDNSDGPTATRGGELGYFRESDDLAQPFKDFIFSHSVGAIDLVETTFGFHIIKIDDKEDAIQMATVAQEVASSEETINTVFRNATTFEIAVSEKDFAETAKENNYELRPVRNLKALDENISGIGIQRSLIQWAFNKDTEIGDVRRFNVNDGYAVAQLTGKTEKGTVSGDVVNTRIQPVLRRQKKAAMIMEKYKGKTLEELSNNNEFPIRTASELTMKKLTIPGVGREPKIIGAALGLDEGKTSGLIEGESGIYKVEVTKKETAQPLDNYSTYAQTRQSLSQGRVFALVYTALKDAAKIEDNRKDFY